MRPRFITLEGGEGTGKSTQARRLARALEASGLKVVLTREPGGAPGAEEVRRLLVEGGVDRWDPLSETLLHYAARNEHLVRTIRPALAAGRWVVSDRFSDSTLAYQGYGHGLEREYVARLQRLVVGSSEPDLTLILDLPVEEGLRRAALRGGAEDRYERMDVGFHQRLREGYLEIAARHLARCAIIDSSGSENDVSVAILSVVTARLGVRFPMSGQGIGGGSTSG